MSSPVRRRLVVTIAAACAVIALALSSFISLSLTPDVSESFLSQAIDRENAHNKQLLTLRHDMQPTLDEFKDILSGMRTTSPQNAALAVYEHIGLRSSAEHAVGSYLHISSYIEDCDVSEDCGTVRVMYECAAITADSEKVVIADRTRATWDIEKRDGSWTVTSVHDDNPALSLDGRP